MRSFADLRKLYLLGAMGRKPHVERAARLFGSTQALHRTIGTSIAPFQRKVYDVNIATIRASLSPELFEGEWQFGSEMSLGEAIDYALVSAARELTCDVLPPTVAPPSLGEYRLRDLDRPEPLFHSLHPASPTAFLPHNTPDNHKMPNNLPVQVTSFIGREKEIEDVKTLLSKTRLLTLTGSGGCSKTRLGLQVATESLENYRSGVWLIELASLTDPAFVPQAVASVLGVREGAGNPLSQTLVAFLTDKKMLLVLDNCEHLLSACALLVDTIIRACPDIVVLASSRERLRIAGETVYHVPSLSLPDLQDADPVQSRYLRSGTALC